MIFFNIGARVVDEMHIIHVRRARGHAGKARQATVDMLHHFCAGLTLIFQHVLHKVDAAARTIEFVTKQDVGGAGGGAKPAMNAFANHRFRHGRLRVRELHI